MLLSVESGNNGVLRQNRMVCPRLMKGMVSVSMVTRRPSTASMDTMAESDELVKLSRAVNFADSQCSNGKSAHGFPVT